MDRPALVPELYVSDLERSLTFYVGLLGFEGVYARPAEHFACLRRGTAHIMLEQAPQLRRATQAEMHAGQWRTADLEYPFGRGLNLEIQVDEVEETYRRLEQAAHAVLLAPHFRTYQVAGEPYTVQQLLVADPDGYLIRLSKRLSTFPL